MAGVIGSHGLLVAAGLIALPCLAHALSPAVYGDASLYVLLLSGVSYLDFARPLLIRTQSAGQHSAAPEDALLCANTWLLLGVSLLAACWLPLAAGVPLLIGVAAHALAALDYARLCADGRVAAASAARNTAWAAAFLASAGLCFVTRGPLAWAWPLAVANLVVLAIYRHWNRGTRLPLAALTEPRRAWQRLDRASRGTIGDLLVFSLAGTGLAVLDRVLLRAFAPESLGAWSAHADLASRIALFGTALSAVVYPQFARVQAEQRPGAAEQALLRLSTWAFVGWSAALCALAVLQRPLLALLLGSDYAAGPSWFALLLPCALLQLPGFLLTPWQRARGDFRTQRRAYTCAAVIALLVGLWAVPTHGAAGALLTCLAARTAEVLMIAHELRVLGSRGPGRLRLACALLLLVTLTALSLWQGLVVSGGAA
jgi:O-antigen/teichoic acid export membrane protein